MDTGVRETVCSKCVHSQVCAHKHGYLDMVKRLEDVFYSVPEKERVGVIFKDPACKYINKGINVPLFVNQKLETSDSLTPEEIVRRAAETSREYKKNMEVSS